MHLASVSAAGRVAREPSRLPLDRRRHERVEVALLGRFMRADRQEYPAKLINISAGGAAMIAPVEVDISEHVVAYFDHIGGIEGRVVRALKGGFAMTIAASRHKREKLAAQLTSLIDCPDHPASLKRRHDRSTLELSLASLKLGTDSVLQASVRNVSISGALLATEARPPIGTEALLGRLRCRVVRHDAEGIGVEFIDIQGSDSLRRHFGRSIS
jgi:hypothetical protein